MEPSVIAAVSGRTGSRSSPAYEIASEGKPGSLGSLAIFGVRGGAGAWCMSIGISDTGLFGP
ncbi:uncharacterized protein MYCGRDRAFT_102715 [Zymoseptoria tritici IPO323]|uniref:Uncharacterized protein n=1 Tax=Zymoseptoria tritici (strain CBS 115943 / IPO323) TaxID=336722 RepID=F9WY87_ZYMTI|nr:uncharacterized protein MYCGRDRAFT_102715 [Zymoseptoria tritici IPO323]EGP91499.1 hypothetical protein MYCGRDRAFT_102715 [Zymoseptoria tritici IPO323]